MSSARTGGACDSAAGLHRFLLMNLRPNNSVRLMHRDVQLVDGLQECRLGTSCRRFLAPSRNLHHQLRQQAKPSPLHQSNRDPIFVQSAFLRTYSFAGPDNGRGDWPHTIPRRGTCRIDRLSPSSSLTISGCAPSAYAPVGLLRSTPCATPLASSSGVRPQSRYGRRSMLPAAWIRTVGGTSDRWNDVPEK